jgi:hypothetical protein
LPVQQRLSLVSYACAKRAVAKAVPWESPKFVETMHRLRCAGKVVVLRAAPESVALGSGTNNVSTPSVAHGAPERPAERL